MTHYRQVVALEVIYDNATRWLHREQPAFWDWTSGLDMGPEESVTVISSSPPSAVPSKGCVICRAPLDDEGDCLEDMTHTGTGQCDFCDERYMIPSTADHCAIEGLCWTHCSDPAMHDPTWQST